jgi:ribose transport system permease protein
MLGIKVNRVRVICFMIAGLLASLAGMLMVARLGSAQPSIGNVWVMASIAAPVIGGVATTGGVGNPLGALIGAAIIGVIENVIVLLGFPPTGRRLSAERSSSWQSPLTPFIATS